MFLRKDTTGTTTAARPSGSCCCGPVRRCVEKKKVCPVHVYVFLLVRPRPLFPLETNNALWRNGDVSQKKTVWVVLGVPDAIKHAAPQAILKDLAASRRTDCVSSMQLPGRAKPNAKVVVVGHVAPPCRCSVEPFGRAFQAHEHDAVVGRLVKFAVCPFTDWTFGRGGAVHRSWWMPSSFAMER